MATFGFHLFGVVNFTAHQHNTGHTLPEIHPKVQSRWRNKSHMKHTLLRVLTVVMEVRLWECECCLCPVGIVGDRIDK